MKYAMLNHIEEVVFIGTIDEIIDIYCRGNLVDLTRSITASANYYRDTGKKRYVNIRRLTKVCFIYDDDKRIKHGIQDYKDDPYKKRYPLPRASTLKKSGQKMTPIGHYRIVGEKKTTSRRVERSKDLIVWERFLSAKDAANKTELSHRNIISVCKGNAKTYDGYFWRYADDDIHINEERTLEERKALDHLQRCFVCGIRSFVSCTFKKGELDILVCKTCCESLTRRKINPVDLI